MSFRVSARTVLELGAELISSDGIAIYELVKNAIDAHSSDGVQVRFVIVLSRGRYVEAIAELAHNSPAALAAAKEHILSGLEPSADAADIAAFSASINKCATVGELRTTLRELYSRFNFIEFIDSGDGMTAADLMDKFLVIGTPSRSRDVTRAERDVRSQPGSATKAPFLGEKGVGRLSAMRLGTVLHLETATASDIDLNVLDIDWERFDAPDLLIDDIDLAPTVGPRKPSPEWSGTRIRISNLQGNWSSNRIKEIAGAEFARLADPFSSGEARFRIVVTFNGSRIAIPRMDRELLSAANASAIARFRVRDARASLEVLLSYRGPQRQERKRLLIDHVDLATVTADDNNPRSALLDLGPFDLEVYWYNRKKLVAIDSIGNLAATRELQKLWSGIMMFRDGYRVSPYGDEADDWLSLDRQALASPGYKLNKLQFIGRVNISRLRNPRLVDQTNREGLKDCPEKRVLVELLRYTLQDLLKRFMDTVNTEQSGDRAVDVNSLEARMSELERRSSRAVGQLKQKYGDNVAEARDIQTLFKDMYDAFNAAIEAAEHAKDEQAKLLHLAGVGLMLEVVAHELARSTETALATLAKAHGDALPPALASTMRTLRAELMTMNKRIRVLDPLSVPGRQRREHFDLIELVRDSYEGRRTQFERHGINATIVVDSKSPFEVHGVKGMYVQIFENLISNSVYWLQRRSSEEADFDPKVVISFKASSRTVAFWDNGPGISPDLKHEVFRAFFSTKDKRRRQGLGLYIARECAVHNGCELTLSDEHTEHADRLNTFLLQVPEV